MPVASNVLPCRTSARTLPASMRIVSPLAASVNDTAASSAWWGNTLAYFGTNLSPALFGVGYIVGLNIGIVMLAGGMIAWKRAGLPTQ